MPKRSGVIYQELTEITDSDQKKQEASQKLTTLAKESGRILLDIKAVFPFNFFPDEVILDETKASIHTNFFFYSKEVRSIEYEDIYNVFIQQGLFFAKLEIVDRFFSQQRICVEYLKKAEAIRARRLIQGMMIVKKDNIDLSKLSVEEVVAKLDRIGKSH